MYNIFIDRQRGSNENTNGLLREYSPKGVDLTDATDEEFITGLTYYSFNREPDTYEINTIKKRLNKFDRLLVKEIYKRAGLNGADSVAYITTSLQNLEKENVYTIEDWEKFQNLSVERDTKDPIPY